MNKMRKDKLKKSKAVFRVVKHVGGWAVQKRQKDRWVGWERDCGSREGADASRMLNVFCWYCNLSGWSWDIASLACLAGGIPDDIVERMHQIATITYGKAEGAPKCEPS